MNTFQIIYTLLGGVGIFLFGIKMLSTGLQALAGEMIKSIINSLTRNRFLAFLVGISITMIVQSSSVTTVMVVGFVNAGLMQLTQAIGIILGANIGTTITGWIISINIGKYGLLFIGISIFPQFLGKSERLKEIGKICMAIGMVFFGLETMSGAFRPLRNSQEFLNALSYFAGENYFSYLASVLTGCLITMLIQSSSAMLGITISLASTGIIPFPTAAALVLGENMGTTITALLASVGASVPAKRAAYAHALFNLVGVALMLIIFPFYVKFIDLIVPGKADFVNINGDHPYMGIHIAMSHTVFNVSAALIFLPFLNVLARIVTKLTPDKFEKETPHLILLGNTDEILPATSIVQAREGLKKQNNILQRMYQVNSQFLSEKGVNPDLLLKIKRYEEIIDNMQREITLFICKVMEKPLTSKQSEQCQAILRITDELESVSDYIDRMAIYKNRLKANIPLEGETSKEFFEFYDQVYNYFMHTVSGIDGPMPYTKRTFESKAREISVLADSIRDKHIKRIADKKYNPLTAITYSDLVVALRKIRNHSLNIAQALGKLSSS